MISHDSSKLETVRVKGEQDEVDEDYVVVEVFQEEQYEDEQTDVEPEEEEEGDMEMQEIIEESENYTLSESE